PSERTRGSVWRMGGYSRRSVRQHKSEAKMKSVASLDHFIDFLILFNDRELRLENLNVERTCLNSFENFRLQVLKRHHTALSIGVRAHGYGSSLGFFSADDEHIGDLARLSLTDLISGLLISVIDLNPYAVFLQFIREFPRVVILIVGDGEDDSLNRGEPCGER